MSNDSDDDSSDVNLTDPDLLKTPDDNSKDLVCPICRNLIQTAAQPSVDDSHVFCYSCLLEALLNKQSCPVCNTRATIRSMIKFSFIDRQISNLQVRCPKSSDGCEWTGPLSDLKNRHWNNECDYNLKPCLLCNVNVLARNLKNHTENKCPQRPVACSMCFMSQIPFKFMDKHIISECPETKINCPNNCGESIVRKFVSNHVNNDCGLEIIPCVLSGCQSMQKREDMCQHVNTNIGQHLLLAIKEIARLKKTQNTKCITYKFQKTFLDLQKLYKPGQYYNFKTIFYNYGMKIKVFPCGIADNHGQDHICLEYRTTIKPINCQAIMKWAVVLKINDIQVKEKEYNFTFSKNVGKLVSSFFYPHNFIRNSDVLSFDVIFMSVKTKFIV